MKRFFRGAFSILLFLLVVSIILSNFVFQESFEKLEIDLGKELPKGLNLSPKLKFAVDVSNIAQYDYLFLKKKGGMDLSDTQAFIPVEVNLLKKLNTPFVILRLTDLPVFTATGEIRENYIKALKDYYSSIKVPVGEEEERLRIMAIRLIEPSVEISYALGKPQDFLKKQLKAASLIYQGNLSGQVILPCGEVLTKGVNKNIVLYQLAKQVFDSLRALEKESDVKLELLWVNSPSLPKETLCQSLEDIQNLIRQIKQLNIANGMPISLIDNRLGVALDTSALYSVWQDKGNPFYKDQKNLPLSHSAFWDKIKAELLGNAQSRVVVKGIFASLYNKDEKEGYHLAFSRAKDSRMVLEQLKFLTQLVQTFGFSEENGFISLEVPIRELFPVVHRIAKPLAKTWGLYRKENGADKSEFIYSHELVVNYLAIHRH